MTNNSRSTKEYTWEKKKKQYFYQFLNPQILAPPPQATNVPSVLQDI